MIRDYNASDGTTNEEENSIFSPGERIEPRPEIKQVEYGSGINMCEDSIFDASENVSLGSGLGTLRKFCGY